MTASADSIDEAVVRARLERAFAKLRADYEASGGWRYPGPIDADMTWGWIGPYAWSEAAYSHRYAMLLEEEFPRAVHLEMPINERMRSDLDPLPEGVKRRAPQYIDIVVADLTPLAELEQTPAVQEPLSGRGGMRHSLRSSGSRRRRAAGRARTSTGSSRACRQIMRGCMPT